ncbi:sensor histidine kinase [Mucilaginibacter lappiensis]|uniref:histidine kinase n=1 Tax=Mucilaginibacter lappiensis TaxID=354630 RepID=A0A1N7B659_9SPHI|nr:HAMP domain-containing sensor histidine kinase [Mucilaginibacter lappiensis]MBB6110731.1 signal transduction histidine kinase [Mucilaginibacter lappiensis]MBB6128223.1 signal transduction histidine kinase [Mucilaginibacter lappiensis]SIR46799.1 Signal transduction histidine kinase [Mucilaginibacter lappiensis]
MKLQVKLALYNTLTKVAIILFTGLLILLSIEKISYNHIEVRLEDDKEETLKSLESNEINRFLSSQQVYTDYNILKEEFISITPIKYDPNVSKEVKFTTEPRNLDKKNFQIYRILSHKFNFNEHTYLLQIGEAIESVEELKSIIKKFTLLVLFIALVLTLISDLIFTKFLLAPFYKIIDRKLIKVNDPMNFDYEKIKTTTQDFELLDDSISSLMKKISNLFILEKQFIANVSHELLTPISIISSRLENILLHEELSEGSENKMHASLKTLNRLKSIINSLLLISKVENNQFDKGDMVMIAGVVKEIHEELEDRIEEKHLTFTNHLKYIYSIQGNRPLMHTLLFNIINNSIKYNNPKGSITISDDLNDDIYAITIADTGAGMEQKQIENAFNRFEKFDTDEKESYGLGLAIVKSITAFHNIKVKISSVKNQGTSVKLIFDHLA